METPSPSRNEVSTSPPMRARVRTVNMYQFDIQLKKWYHSVVLGKSATIYCLCSAVL